MASNAKVLGVGVVGLFLGFAALVGGAKLSPEICRRICPLVPPGPNPPVIIHGGSMHLSVISSGQVDTGEPIPVIATDMTTLGLHGYVDGNGVAVQTVPLATNWEVDVCDDKPTSGSPGKCTNGWTLCSTSTSPCSLTGPLPPSGQDGTITITTLGGKSDKPSVPPQFQHEHLYKFYDSQGKNGGAYHPAWIQVFQTSGKTTVTTTISCGVDPNKTTDWSSCWLAMGSPPATVQAASPND
jgi:hypothetical protein